MPELPESPSVAAPEAAPLHRSGVFALAFGALGVVYGDIGTSPLYALRECFHGPHATAPSEAAVLGVLSLVFWSLTLLVSVQYLAFLLRADNRGEGGIFALLALVPTAHRTRSVKGVIALALLGAALLYGDGMITPAISVLSAVEGLSVATKAADPYLVPIAAGILLGLFVVQRRGTGRIGVVFGPVMLAWFLAITATGLPHVLEDPSILRALNPVHAFRFIGQGGAKIVFVLASVVLVVTGTEALYADMGHFGKSAIRRAWFAVVFPALLVNYFGQGALILRDPATAANPFYALVPGGLLFPMVALATAATAIASQAMISGAFSVTRQAMQLGYLPRMQLRHTSSEVQGQIYVPLVNRVLMFGCLALVLIFRNSSSLAGAYGIAVTGAMTITAIVYGFVLTRRWGWPVGRALPLTLAFLVFPLGFLIANSVKLLDGGWIPILIAAGVFAVMSTWNRGRALVTQRAAGRRVLLDTFREDLVKTGIARVPGTAVFMTSTPEDAPVALLHQIKHNRVLHESVVLLTVRTENEPVVPPSEQVEWESLGAGFHRVLVRYGFMQTPDVPDALRRARLLGLEGAPQATTWFLGRESIVTQRGGDLARWRKSLFSFLWRNSVPPTVYYRLPPDRVIELGTLVEL